MNVIRSSCTADPTDLGGDRNNSDGITDITPTTKPPTTKAPCNITPPPTKPQPDKKPMQTNYMPTA